MVTQEEHDLAAARGRQIRESGRYIVAAKYDAASQIIQVTFKAGFAISFAKERCQITAKATDEQLREIEISAAGWSADFPKLGDGITAEALLAGCFGTAKWEHEWVEKHREMQAA